MKKNILCLVRGREHLIRELLDVDNFNCLIDDTWSEEIIDKICPDLVLSIGESNHEIYKCYKKAKAKNIPTLTLQDGIPEWRDIWENPKYSYGGGQLNRQLFFADKVACHGRLHQSLFSAWGMANKCEIVGIPWFDKYFSTYQKPKTKYIGDKVNVLVATANNPAFNEDQYRAVVDALNDLNTYLSKNNKFDVKWRIRGRVANSINSKIIIENDGDLKDVLSGCDCVITTPSTLQLESMIMGLQTVLMDYTYTPKYVNSAWNIHNKESIPKVLSQIEFYDQKRMLFQDFILNDYLALDGMSTVRLVDLIYKMIFHAERCRTCGEDLVFKTNLLNSTIFSNINNSIYYDLAALHPNHDVFSIKEIDQLRLELINCKQENEILKKDLTSRRLGYWVSAAGRFLAKQVNLRK